MPSRDFSRGKRQDSGEKVLQVADILGQENDGHPTLAQLALDGVAAGESSLQAFSEWLGHDVPSVSTAS